MQNGDVLKTINGFDMASPEKALEAYARSRTAWTNLTIRLTRGTKGAEYRLQHQVAARFALALPEWLVVQTPYGQVWSRLSICRQGDTILVGTSLDAPSAVALRRAVALARTRSTRSCASSMLIPWDAEPIRRVGRRAAPDDRGVGRALGAHHPQPRHDRFAAWEPAMALAREAVENDAPLVVIGASAAPRATRGRGSVFCNCASVPLLVAQSPDFRGPIAPRLILRPQLSGSPMPLSRMGGRSRAPRG